jgi:hypothetical protein
MTVRQSCGQYGIVACDTTVITTGKKRAGAAEDGTED